jgi:hypothetical protein
MNIRFSRLVAGMLVFALALSMAGHCWAIYNVLGPSKDEWGLKYDVQVNDAGNGNVTVVLTVADEGRLKPFYKLELIAMSEEMDKEGGRAYDVKATIELKPTKDGRLVGQAQMRKEFLNRAQIRMLTDRFDGQPQQWLACYEVPVSRFVDKDSAGPLPVATQPTLKATK